MSWNIDFYHGVMDSILDMPPKIQARMLKLLELMEQHGANLGSPHTEPMGNGLFELRAKAQEGIGRGLFCYLDGSNIYILHAFVKKSQKTPKKDLDLAKSRMKEVKK
ncbi:type II toxin-antitoxin system RelE/ParE family toxin [Xenorhabdus sp. DI]|uniref:Type II toxin-antitoxin system RelE/ParE family toxin n=1 Tax=Xenorhabdus szentirmaii TaxID=290112 RepID=A0AAW3YZ69_9GAMM|nr:MULTISPECIES: type II toxin-antitoxin system RelE/ParE family toxin [unclassified Xenorhabdus]MBD2786521.1 type II toxin-antitoxin system RelE/ParE family toxin [Xenorhabdus sp. 3]MBD2790321.1 type II toxin-antitoxin system RelE/ParE family toxin [Xenorhabdus sp. DI]MBD2802116.1 type II toxin-antitoxin system RelE/ParE family toxin [Xenorhabdus sp. M]MDC9583276.1 type II toxin-antitoxin system RelE/ParE family toxin [Xenorhabdus sp. PR6a]